MQFKWHKNKITSTSQVYLIGGSKGKQTSEAGWFAFALVVGSWLYLLYSS